MTNPAQHTIKIFGSLRKASLINTSFLILDVYEMWNNLKSSIILTGLNYFQANGKKDAYISSTVSYFNQVYSFV